MIASPRSYLTVGLSAGMVLAASGAAVVTPTAGSAPITAASPAVQLSAALTPLLPAIPSVAVGGLAESPGDWIINAYGVIQPWVEYGVELFAWATEWLPWPIGLLAPQADIIYSGWQPFAESVVYSFAFLLDGEFDLILPTLSAGIQTGVTNLVQGEIAWILSFFPPLPPIGPAAATAATTVTTGRTAQPASAEAAARTEGEVPESEPGSPQSGQTGTAAVEAASSEPEAAMAVGAEEQPVTVTVVEPAAPAQPARQAPRGTARMPRSVPAASAAAVTETITTPPAVNAGPSPEPRAHKASRAGDSGARDGRATRAAR